MPGCSPYLDAIPVLAGEGVLGLLLETLLALGQSLVPAGVAKLARPFAHADMVIVECRLAGRRGHLEGVRTFQQPSLRALVSSMDNGAVSGDGDVLGVVVIFQVGKFFVGECVSENPPSYGVAKGRVLIGPSVLGLSNHSACRR